MTTTQEIYDQGVQEGLTKNAIIMAISEVMPDGDILRAANEFKTLARKAGDILSYKDRTAAIDEILQGQDITSAEVRKNLTEQLSLRYDISYQTAQAHIKSFAERNGINLPIMRRHSGEDVRKFVADKLDSGLTREECEQALVDEMGYQEASAKSAFIKAAKELGYSTSRANAQLPEIVAFCIENAELSRKELTQAIAEQFEYKESTAASYTVMVAFAKEYCRQVSDSE